jgi:ABC-2 type transport system ATP-binding protein
VPALERELPVISTKMLAGRTFVNVFSESSPGTDFELVEPDLKDVYFSAMGRHYRSSDAGAAPAGADR